MILRYSCLKVFSLMLSALMLAACGGSKKGGNPPPEEPVPINVTILGPSTANEGEVVVLKAMHGPLEQDSYYFWSQTGGDYLEWVQTDDQIEVTIPRVSADTVFSFEVVAVSSNQQNSFASHSIVVTDEFDLTSNGEQASSTALASITQLLQYGNLTRDLLSALPGPGETPCTNGGLYTSTLIDADSDSSRSVGDTLTIDFRECTIEPFEAPLSGRLAVEFTEFSADLGQWRAQITLDSISVEREETELLTSVLDVSFDRSDNIRTLSIEAESGSFEKNSETQFDFRNFSLQRVENLNAATYSITANVQIDDSTSDGEYTFETNTPFMGYLNEYPHEGSATLSHGDAESALLESNFVTNSGYLQLITEDSTAELPWSSLTSGVFWSVGDAYRPYAEEFRSDNFAFVGEANVINTRKAPLDPAFSVVFSRPINSIVNANSVFETTEFPYQRVAAEISFDGAVVTVTPAYPLEPATEYRVPGVEVLGPFGQRASSHGFEFTTSNAIIPVITSATRFYRHNDTPVLHADDSELNEGNQIFYRWTEITDQGVVFDEAEAASTSFTVPEDAAGDIIIELTVSNEFGASASAQATLTQLDDTGTFIALESAPGDYIGAGDTYQYTLSDGTISSTSTKESPEHISVALDAGTTWWHMDIAAPNGDALAVQRYVGATRYPFQSPTAPGFDFSGSGRGCNQSYSEFEVLELEYNDEGELFRLAVDFVQYCESPEAPPLKGMVRLNSTLGLE